MKEQPKVYKHPRLGRMAVPTDLKGRKGRYRLSVGDGKELYRPEDLLALGFEEVLQEEQKEVPAWFLNFLDDGDEDSTDEDMYKLFLKHYPQQDTPPQAS